MPNSPTYANNFGMKIQIFDKEMHKRRYLDIFKIDGHFFNPLFLIRNGGENTEKKSLMKSLHFRSLQKWIERKNEGLLG